MRGDDILSYSVQTSEKRYTLRSYPRVLPDRDAVGGPRHGQAREQSGGSLPPIDPVAGEPAAAVQIRRPRATVSLGARARLASPSAGPSPSEGTHHRLLRARSFHVWDEVPPAH